MCTKVPDGCNLQAHNVAIEEAQHFEKIIVKSVLGYPNL